MRIGLDFDNTITANPEYFKSLVEMTIEHGVSIVIVTARRDTPENRETVKEFLAEHGFPKITAFYTNLRSKIKYMDEAGLHVDIWIEDDPLTCALGH